MFLENKIALISGTIRGIYDAISLHRPRMEYWRWRDSFLRIHPLEHHDVSYRIAGFHVGYGIAYLVE